MSIYATKSLLEQVEEEIDSSLSSVIGPFKRLVWWDKEGFLQEIVEEACNNLDVECLIAEKNPLSLRKKTLEKNNEFQVWYIPEAKKGRDWFRDIKESGDQCEIICSLDKMAGKVYEVNQKEIIDFTTIDDKEKKIKLSNVIKEELLGKHRPNLNELKGKLITEGHGDPVEYILREGWKLEKSDYIKSQVIKLINNQGIKTINKNDKPDIIVKKLRDWAVAQWLVFAGLKVEYLPFEYENINSLSAPNLISKLKRILKEKPGLANKYMEHRWPEAIEKTDDIWELYDCPVGGSLEYKLWNKWQEKWNEGEICWCRNKAKKRWQALNKTYGSKNDFNKQGSKAWVKSWYQAYLLVDVSIELSEKISYENKNVSLAEHYGDKNEGIWLIDKKVREIMVSGSPERELPEDHPSKEFLKDVRIKKLNEYTKHLEEVAETTEKVFKNGEMLKGMKSAHKFWDENKNELSSGEMVVLFYIDALRYDLACDLADKLRKITKNEANINYDIKEEIWASVFPTETSFGMGALIPGRSITYEIKYTSGKLKPQKNNQNLNTDKREKILKEEGWKVTRDLKKGWENSRVAYFDTKFDDIGEKNLAEIEKAIDRRVDELANAIKNILEKGDWPKAYVITDHGFVLLPSNCSLENISPPSGAEDVKRRRCILNENPAETLNGLTLSNDYPQLEYLKVPVNMLINPLQRYKKKGMTDSRYSHGGALPQEFILNFLKIERS